MWIAACLLAQAFTTLDVVENGAAEHAHFLRGEWEQQDGALVAGGVGRQLVADVQLWADWTVTVELSLDELDGTAASMVFDSAHHLGFDGREGGFFVEGSFARGSARSLEILEDVAALEDGAVFAVEAKMAGDRLTFSINGEEVKVVEHARKLVSVALRPHRSTMRVRNFRVEGRVRAGLTPESIEQTDVFVSGEGGYDTYRIPSLTSAPNGDLLAFCEGRKASSSDAGDIDLLLRRSKDNGRTWLPVQTIWDDGKNTCGNPCVVVDENTETIHLLMTHNLGEDHEPEIIKGRSKGTRTVWITSSKDDGETWSEPREITSSVKHDDWTWYATGPGAGIQMVTRAHKGRLVVPADHIERDTEKYYSHVIYSDDGGETWQDGGSTPRDQTNECEVIELVNGQLLLNSRNYDRTKHTRQVSLSDDGGATWHDQHHDEALIEPICQASIRRMGWPSGFDPKSPDPKPDERQYPPDFILFSNPASTDARAVMKVRVSYDDGKTWPYDEIVYAGPAAYSCLAKTKKGMGLLYEADEYARIVFADLYLPAFYPW